MALIILLSLLLLNLAGLTYLHIRTIRNTNKAIEKLRYNIVEFTKPRGTDDNPTPSQFALFVDQIASTFSARLSTTMLATYQGMLGGVQKGMNAAVANEVIDSNPNLAILKAASPKIMRKLGKNPVALLALDAITKRVLSNVGNIQSGVGDNHNLPNQSQFNI